MTLLHLLAIPVTLPYHLAWFAYHLPHAGGTIDGYPPKPRLRHYLSLSNLATAWWFARRWSIGWPEGKP